MVYNEKQTRDGYSKQIIAVVKGLIFQSGFDIYKESMSRWSTNIELFAAP